MSFARIAMLSLGLALAPTAAFSHDSAEAGLEQVLVESASTPKQHEALAKFYRAEAAEARARAAEHKKMAGSYGGTKMAIAQAGKEHCDKLAALNESTAQEYDKLAAEHETLAKK